jgi:dihydrofolate reductase
MRKLKLQMQITVDGFVAGPNGEFDWMAPPDDSMTPIIHRLIDTSDTILMGRKMAADFMKYWESVKPESPDYAFAQKMVNTPKIVFSRTVKNIEGRNARIENAPLVDAVNRLRSQSGKDIIVYGGASFVASLLENDLLDELTLSVNPIAIGNGMRIFTTRVPLKLVDSARYATGEVVNTYERADR